MRNYLDSYLVYCHNLFHYLFDNMFHYEHLKITNYIMLSIDLSLTYETLYECEFSHISSTPLVIFSDIYAFAKESQIL